uniref:SdrD B-like domain-containing protein n=1 Tax=Pseudolysinimonas sp. TaxID=2680009 RepID=UPI00286CE39C
GAGPASPTPTVIDTGITGSDRPWALTIRDDLIYLGVTDTATMSTGARVISRAVSGGAWTTALTVPLNYSRGIVWAADPPGNPVTTGQVAAQWHAWEDNPSTIWNNANSLATFFRAWAQPILSGLSFDDGGNLVMGFTDRFNYQTGVAAMYPGGTGVGDAYNRSNVTGAPVGEVLYAGRSSAGTLVLESGGTGATGGNVTATSAGNSTVVLAPSYGTAAQNRAGTVPAPGQTARQNIQHGGREFFEDSVMWDGQGSPPENTSEGVVHDETVLGAVAIVPGTSQLTATSFDPALRYNNAGNRFMSLSDGHSIDGFDQYTGGNPHFGKAGGLGGVSYLLAEAPVEIGNRVWYDADLDGIQDPDEAAINGAPVELWTADGSGDPVTQLATTTTATITGQAGTYFFRTVDASTGGTTGFVKGADYVVVFPKPASGSPTLVWPTTTPDGFAGLTWAQLTRTSPNAGSNDLTDSDPAVATGRVVVAVGETGENDHSIDAGWYGVSTFRIQKTVVGTPPAGATFSIEVASATNFRSENQLGAGGPSTTPIVDTLTYTLTAGGLETSVEEIPYGYTLTFSEPGMPAAAVSFSPNTGVGDDTGSLLIAPTGTAGGQLLTVTNSYTSIEVTKALSSAVTLPPDTTFPIEYTVEGGPIETAEVAVGPSGIVTIGGVPWGAEIEIREPLEGPFSWGGWIWRTGTWTLGATELIADGDGWVTVTGGSTTDPLELTITNHPIDAPALPFTGGVASDAFLIAGGSGVLIALALGTWHLTKRPPRRVALHRL